MWDLAAIILRGGEKGPGFMTVILLFLLGMVGLAMAVDAFRHTRQVKSFLGQSQARNHLPRVISTLIITVQFSELLKVIDHVSVTHVVGALLLLVVMLVTKAGTEGELKS